MKARHDTLCVCEQGCNLLYFATFILGVLSNFDTVYISR
jgi:hypothetical protein